MLNYRKQELHKNILIIADLQFFKALCLLPFINRVILYGSRARGDHHELADVDLAIDCVGATDHDWLALLDMIGNADTLLKIDCVRYDTLSHDNPLKLAIDKEGVILYQKGALSPQTQLAFQKLGKALKALGVMVRKPDDPDRSNIDATIQRFEFSIELFWKALKKLMLDFGKETYLPKEILQEAYSNALIHQPDAWLQMLKDRNETSHTYDQELADKIFRHIKKHYPVMQETFDALHAKFLEPPKGGCLAT